MAETNGLLNRHTLNGVSRVRIPPSPQKGNQFSDSPFLFFERTSNKSTVIFLGLEGKIVVRKSFTEGMDNKNPDKLNSVKSKKI